ncbi:MAG: radical SAM protein [Nitrospirae bacterium]|nr:radical SAM protein [Nitrospirota bacterium]MCL5976705.1 radical SAM protein [Nitrospirota bacterium]
MIPESNEIRIEVTTKCNYNCVICPREKLTRNKETMDFELFNFLFNKITAETDQYNTLTFPGMGEPLLDGGLSEKVAYAKKKGFTVLVLTNGSLLSVDKFKQLQDSGVDSIRISMYGNTPESYASVHGIKESGLFNKVKDSLTEISKIRTTTKLLFTYNIVDGVNDSTLQEWIDYWRDRSDLLEVWRPHNWVDSKSYRDVQHNKLKTCGRPFKTPLQMQVDGTVNMCCFDFDGKLLLGDLKMQSLEEIFESPMFKKIEQCHLTGDFENSGLICENCDQRNVDKSDVMVYNSKFDIEERVKKVSTTYMDVV